MEKLVKHLQLPTRGLIALDLQGGRLAITGEMQPPAEQGCCRGDLSVRRSNKVILHSRRTGNMGLFFFVFKSCAQRELSVLNIFIQ